MSITKDFETACGKPKTFKEKVRRAAWIALTYISIAAVLIIYFIIGILSMNFTRG